MSVRARCAGLLGAALTLLLLPAVAASAAETPSPWLQNGYNAAGSNANTTESTLTPDTVRGLAPLRTFAGQGEGCYEGPGVYTDPVLSESYVYAFDGHSLVATAAATGRQVWQTPLADTDYENYHVLAVTHGLVLVANSECYTQDPNDRVSAYHSSDGSYAWTLPQPYADGVGGLHVSGKYVVLQTNEDEAQAYELSVFRLYDGGLVWTKDYDDGIYQPNTVVVGRRVFSPVRTDPASFDLSTRAFDLATGRTVWTDPTGAYPERGDTDAVSDAHLYAQLDGTVYDENPATGARRVTFAGASHTYAVDASRLYARCNKDRRVCAYDRRTGAPLTSYRSGGQPSSFLVANGVVYYSLDLDGATTGVAADAATGRVLTRFPGRPAAVAQGRVAVLTDDGGLTLYGLPGS